MKDKKSKNNKIVKTIGIIAAAICFLGVSLFGPHCIAAAVGVTIGLPMALCMNTCVECGAEPYPFIHETESFDDVRIELVTLSVKELDGEFLEYVIEVNAEIEKKDLFMEEFGALRFTFPYEPYYGISTGEAICFTYPDGQVEIVTRYGCGLYADNTLQEDIGFNGRAGGDGLTELWNRWAQ